MLFGMSEEVAGGGGGRDERVVKHFFDFGSGGGVLIVENKETSIFGRVDNLGSDFVAAAVEIVEGDFGNCS